MKIEMLMKTLLHPKIGFSFKLTGHNNALMLTHQNIKIKFANEIEQFNKSK